MKQMMTLTLASVLVLGGMTTQAQKSTLTTQDRLTSGSKALMYGTVAAGSAFIVGRVGGSCLASLNDDLKRSSFGDLLSSLTFAVPYLGSLAWGSFTAVRRSLPLFKEALDGTRTVEQEVEVTLPLSTGERFTEGAKGVGILPLGALASYVAYHFVSDRLDSDLWTKNDGTEYTVKENVSFALAHGCVIWAVAKMAGYSFEAFKNAYQGQKTIREVLPVDTETIAKN